MKIKFNFNGRQVVLEGIVCRSFFSKLRGLMFGNDKENLIFVFSRPTRMAIHSFFVRKKFAAIWLLNGRVVDAKVVKPWALSVRPKSKFNMLIEVPMEKGVTIPEFLVGVRKIYKDKKL